MYKLCSTYRQTLARYVITMETILYFSAYTISLVTLEVSKVKTAKLIKKLVPVYNCEIMQHKLLPKIMHNFESNSD